MVEKNAGALTDITITLNWAEVEDHIPYSLEKIGGGGKGAALKVTNEL